jgi:hypothetical protein
VYRRVWRKQRAGQKRRGHVKLQRKGQQRRLDDEKNVM